MASATKFDSSAWKRKADEKKGRCPGVGKEGPRAEEGPASPLGVTKMEAGKRHQPPTPSTTPEPWYPTAEGNAATTTIQD